MEDPYRLGWNTSHTVHIEHPGLMSWSMLASTSRIIKLSHLSHGTYQIISFSALISPLTTPTLLTPRTPTLNPMQAAQILPKIEPTASPPRTVVPTPALAPLSRKCLITSNVASSTTKVAATRRNLVEECTSVTLAVKVVILAANALPNR